MKVSETVKAFFLRKIPTDFPTKTFCFCAASGLSFPIWRGLLALGYDKGLPPGCIQPDLLVLMPNVGALGLPLVSLSIIKKDRFLAGLGFLLTAGVAVVWFVLPPPY